MEFAQGWNCMEKNSVNLPKVKKELQDTMKDLPRFKNVETQDLIRLASQVPGGNKVSITDRLTAIVLLLGTKKLDDPSLRIPLSLGGRDISVSAYA